MQRLCLLVRIAAVQQCPALVMAEGAAGLVSWPVRPAGEQEAETDFEPAEGDQQAAEFW